MFVCLSICSDKPWSDDMSWQCALIFKAALSYISESTSSQLTPCKHQTKAIPDPIKLRAATPRAETHINWWWWNAT